MASYDQQLRSHFDWLREPDPDAVASLPLYMAFDLLYHDGRDLTARSLRGRRARLKDTVAGSELVFPVRRLAPDGLATAAVAGEGIAFELRQTLATLRAPAKEFEPLLMAHWLRHTGSPVMRWMVANVIVTMDAAGNIMPSKEKSGNKIDGVSAAVVALERPWSTQARASTTSARRCSRIYEQRFPTATGVPGAPPSPSARFSASSGGRP